MGPGRQIGVAAAALGVVWAVVMGRGDAQAPRSPGGAAPATGAPAHAHGTPARWTFRWPGGGDPARGRDVFHKLECFSCHEVRGEAFPEPSDRARVGPELSAMGPLHPPEYFAEAIINPGAVIERGHGYEARDGTSKMPSYNDAMTVQEAVDLVAYLSQLRPASPASPGAPPAAAPAHKHP